MTEKLLYPTHSVRCIITAPSECGISVFLIILILNIIKEYVKIYIYSPSLHQNFFQKIIKSFSDYIPIHIIPNILKEQDSDVMFDKIVNIEDFQKSDVEIETFDNIAELKFPQEYDDGGNLILDDLNENEMNAPRVQAMFKQSRRNNLSIFIISQGYYELPKRIIRANGNIYHIFRPNNFRDVKNLHQAKARMDMTPNDFKNVTNICWKEK